MYLRMELYRFYFGLIIRRNLVERRDNSEQQSAFPFQELLVKRSNFTGIRKNLKAVAIAEPEATAVPVSTVATVIITTSYTETVVGTAEVTNCAPLLDISREVIDVGLVEFVRLFL